MPDNDRRWRVGLLQMNSVLGDVEANLKRAEALLAEIGEEADIACLPEMFNVGYDLEALDDRIFELAEPVPEGPTTRRLAELAQALDTALIAGVIERDHHVTGLVYDTAVVVDRTGGYVGRYRKSHLYPAENAYFRAGDDLPVFEVDGLQMGIAICFEAAFPPIFSTLALHGAQVIFNPSAIPVGYGYLQDLRTRARAQDNQCFVAAVNHVGQEGQVTYCGQSQIADPRGEVLALASSEQASALVVDINLPLIREQRLQEPVFRGFRPEMYQF